MKIGFVDYVFERHSPIGANGLSEVVWRLAEPLAAFGHEVHVAGPYKTSELPVIKGIAVHPFEVPGLWYRNIVGHSLIVKKAIETLQQQSSFDVFHAPEYLSTGLFSLLDSTTPLVLTEPGNIYERIANGNPYDFVTTQVYKLMARRTARSRTVIIATSEEMAQWWQRTGSDPGRIARIPLGVDLKDFSPIDQARRQLGWSDKHKHILFVARLSVETGAQYLIEALPAILKQFPQTRLHLVGSGLAENSLRDMVHRLNLNQAVEWHGWVSLKDLACYYSAADLMVFPGTSGGTPRVMLQAMSCGTPFVGSAIGGITDHVEHEVTGLLVPARDYQRLATEVNRVLANPVEARGRAERARSYVETLSWTNIANRVLKEVYQPLLETRCLVSSGV